MINKASIQTYVEKNAMKLVIAFAVMGVAVLAKILDIQLHGVHGGLLAIGALDDFGEQFVAKSLRRLRLSAIYPAITNKNYEGEIKQYGDRLNMLSFPGEAQLQDYVSGTDMGTDAIFDLEDQLVVEKRKAWNFPIDKLEKMFTYVDDAQDNLSENYTKSLERAIDTYVLEQAQFAKAGSWVGIDIRIVGSSRDTEASVATTSTGGNVTVQSATVSGPASAEHGDGSSDFVGFHATDVGKPIRLTSGLSFATEWYRITAVTSSTVVAVENWDGAVNALDIPNGDILRGLAGSLALTGGVANGDGKPTTEGGWGWELQAGRATTITASVVYEQIVALAEKLDGQEIPDTDRHLTGNETFKALLKQASELQPAILMAYEDVIVNGKIATVGGFTVHMATGARVSTRLARPTVASGLGTDIVLTDGARAQQILANHTSFITFGYKWSESRVVEAENQFATKYQALHLYGAKVAGIRRAAGAVLFGTI